MSVFTEGRSAPQKERKLPRERGPSLFRVHGYLREGFDLIAHRGNSLDRPENTLESFAEAVKLWPDAILELDARRTRDGQVVVAHDPTTERTCDRPARISELSFEELRLLDAAHWFSPGQGRGFPFRGKGHAVPRLLEVLTAFPASRVSIDIKDEAPGHVEEVLDAVDRAGAVNRVIVSSESDANLREVRRLDARFATGYAFREICQALLSDMVFKGRFFPVAGDVLQIPVRENVGPGRALHVRVLTRSLVDLAHAHGKKVHVWTVNDPDEMRRLISLGVDGIITDDVGALAKVAREEGLIA